ncbi:dTMP kinase [uncultured Rhodoblastus sp.]|uniref:dTMP kinase n=1 Tax=uncultured Rhodoblastus sp. TaxID=543037 RepID=UPI0025DDE035|nr:dTMP kinase [uncultured Rhodoblastus sp.]
MHHARFITFEGGEGAGKTTQIRLLAERLRQMAPDARREVVVTREPGGTPLAEKLRAVILSGGARQLGPLGEALLFSAARIDHIDRIIGPALRRGAFVLCDRFADSTLAYQGAKGGVDAGLLKAMEKVALGALAPDLTFILDLPPEMGLERARRRRGADEADRFEGEDLSFHAQLRERFLAIAEAEPQRCRVIAAAMPPEKVAAQIWRAVDEKFLGRSAEARQWA